MRFEYVDLSEERLTFGALSPVLAVENLVSLVEIEVVVGLGSSPEPAVFVDSKLAGFTQIVGYGPDRLGQPVVILAMAAMIVGTNRGLIHRGDHG